jgi:hypothetical protein
MQQFRSFRVPQSTIESQLQRPFAGGKFNLFLVTIGFPSLKLTFRTPGATGLGIPQRFNRYPDLICGLGARGATRPTPAQLRCSSKAR